MQALGHASVDVFGAGGRREGRVLGGVFRPRFSGRIWRYLRVRLGVVLVGCTQEGRTTLNLETPTKECTLVLDLGQKMKRGLGGVGWGSRRTGVELVFKLK